MILYVAQCCDLHFIEVETSKEAAVMRIEELARERGYSVTWWEDDKCHATLDNSINSAVALIHPKKVLN